jgi:RNA polymerase sigma-70 factor (ECF subfamily)
MAAGDDFSRLLERVKAGDESASAELYRVYAPHVLRMIRVRLTDSRLRQRVDTDDICQSVFGMFFKSASDGQFEIDSSEQLIRLLATMARNRVFHHVGKQQAAKRDLRRGQAGEMHPSFAAIDLLTPDRVAEARETLELLRAELSPEDRYLVDQRAEGRTWAELSDKVGQSADALRVRVRRALARVQTLLEIEE